MLPFHVSSKFRIDYTLKALSGSLITIPGILDMIDITVESIVQTWCSSGHMKKGLNPITMTQLAFGSPRLLTTIITELLTSIIALAEGVVIGRSFAMFKNYHIDGNKEMIAFSVMNIAASCTACYLSAGPFSRFVVNFNVGCKTTASNTVMAIAVMVTLLFLTPFFYYTPLLVLSSIIMDVMLSLIDYQAALHL